MLSRKKPVHEVEVISVDATGADLRTKTGGEYGVVRISFKEKIETIDQAKVAFAQVIDHFNIRKKK